jgi:hypothetical protein
MVLNCVAVLRLRKSARLFGVPFLSILKEYLVTSLLLEISYLSYTTATHYIKYGPFKLHKKLYKPFLPTIACMRRNRITTYIPTG